MSLQKFLLIILLAFFLISSSKGIDYYSPENILKFADYLYSEKDYQRAGIEYERYISLADSVSEEILYKIGLCYRNSRDIGKAIKYFQRIETEYPETNLRPALYYQIAYCYVISGRYDDSIKYVDENINKLKNPDEITKLQILKALCYLKQKRWYEAKKFLDSITLPANSDNLSYMLQSLRRNAQEGIAIKRKNPILAGTLSFLIPGSGKVYCKQYGDGIFSFMLTTATGLLAYNTFRGDKIRSIKGWIFAGISAIFYAGNIYGSYVSAKIYNNQMEMNILNNLAEIPDE